MTEIAGAATHTDVSQPTVALSAVSNLGGLATAAATGNIKAGQAAATITGVASLAASPKDATQKIATAVDAVQTGFSAANLAASSAGSVASAIQGALAPTPPPPPAPRPPSKPSCSVPGAC